MKHLFTLVLCSLFFTGSFAQNLTAIRYETWNQGAWHNTQHRACSTDPAGNITDQLVTQYNRTTGTWHKHHRFATEYNTDGTIHIFRVDMWDNAANSWTPYTKEQHTYSATGKRTGSVVQEDRSGTWSDLSRSVYTYDSSGNLVQVSYEMWSTPAGTMKPHSRTLYTNNPDGTAASEISQNWKEDQQSWENGEQVQYTYEPGPARVLTSTKLQWFSGSWNPYLRTTNTYSPTSDSTFYESHATGSWERSALEVKTYNSNGKLLEQLTLRWRIQLSDWENADRVTYYYESPTGLGRHILKKPLEVYPNPATHTLSCSLTANPPAAIKVIDALGRTVLVQACEGINVQVDISSLVPAVYTLVAEQGSVISAARFLKQ